MPARTSRFRFEVGAGAEELPDWWPGNHDPLVYLTFGSVAAGEHLPYYPALYRLAVEALSPLPVRVLVTVGDAARKVEELAKVPSNAHVETWVAHGDVARRADVIVCHGGFGSTLGALAHGTPLVILRLFSSDQWADGQAVVRAGAGITIGDDRGARNVLDLPAAETIRGLADAVSSIVDDPTYRGRAGRIANAMSALRRSTSRCSCWKQSLHRTSISSVPVSGRPRRSYRGRRGGATGPGARDRPHDGGRGALRGDLDFAEPTAPAARPPT